MGRVKEIFYLKDDVGDTFHLSLKEVDVLGRGGYLEGLYCGSDYTIEEQNMEDGYK